MTPIQQFENHPKYKHGIEITLILPPPAGGDKPSSCHIYLEDEDGGADWLLLIGTVKFEDMFMAKDMVAVEQALNEWLDDLGIEGIGSRPVFFRSMPDESDEDNSQLFEWNVYNKGELK